MPDTSTKQKAIDMLQNTDKSKAEIARELDVSKQTVAAYAAHMTMGTYEGNETEDFQPAVSRERDVENYLAENLDALEDGLALKEDGQQYQTPVGRIDLLAEDRNGAPAVIELKRGTAKDSALGQILGYLEEIGGEDVRGIIVAERFSSRLQKAVQRFDEIKLCSYTVEYHFEAV